MASVTRPWSTFVSRSTVPKGCIELDGNPGVAVSSDRYKYPFGSHAVTRYGKPFAHFYELIRQLADCIAEDASPWRPTARTV